MNNLQAQLDADVAAVEGEGLVIFRFNGAEYTGQRTPIKGDVNMAEAGFELTYDFTLEVRTSQFVSPKRPPSDEEMIEIGDTQYHIVSVTPDQYGVVNTYAVKQRS